jgi:hypothetical protein
LPPTSEAKVTNYLASELPCYAAVRYLNTHYGHDYRAWGTECESTQYYANGTLISDVFSTGSVLRVFAGYTNMPPPGIFWDRLKPLNVGWLILPTEAPAVRAEMTAHHLFRFVGTKGPEDLFEVNRFP